MAECAHPKARRRADENFEVQTCLDCGAYRFAIDEDLIAFVIGPWGAWRAVPAQRTVPSDGPEA